MDFLPEKLNNFNIMIHVPGISMVIYVNLNYVNVYFDMSRAMGKCVFGVNLAILRFCDFYTGHYMKSKLVFV